MTLFRIVFAALALGGTPLPAGAAFELSEDYVTRPELRTGYYICRTVYDLYSASLSVVR
jgi:hypothetical protein